MAYSPITSWHIEGEKVGGVTDFIFLGSKITMDRDCSHEMKRCLLLGRKASSSCSVTQFFLTVCGSMDCSMPGLPVPHHLPKFAQVHVRCISDAIQPSISSSDALFSFCPQTFPASGTFPMSQLFALGDQNTGASASASVLPTRIQG